MEKTTDGLRVWVGLGWGVPVQQASVPDSKFTTLLNRHPELVSGSISNLASALAARWMLKRVQHDDISM